MHHYEEIRAGGYTGQLYRGSASYGLIEDENALFVKGMEDIAEKAKADGRDLSHAEIRTFNRLEQNALNSRKMLDQADQAGQQSSTPGRAIPMSGDGEGVLFNGDGSRSALRVGGNQSTAIGGQILAESIRSLSGGGGLGQVITPPDHSQVVYDHLAARSVGLLSGFTVLTTENDELQIPHTTTDGTASWTAEGATITTGDVGAEMITAILRKLGVIQQSSNEVINDAHPGVLDIVFNRLTRAMANKLDLGFYEGSGVAPEIRGLRNVAGIGAVSMGTNGAAFTNLDPFANAIGLLEENNANATAIVMHPRSWKALLKVKDNSTDSTKPLLQESAGSGSQGIERRLYGVPVHLSSQLSITETQGTANAIASSAYVYDAPRVLAVRRQEVTLELDRSRLFNSDQSEIRAISRWDIVVPDPEVVVRIAGIL